MHGRSEISNLRSFVRGVQSSLWRSLSEVERGLGRLESVYSEQLKKARKKALTRTVSSTLLTTTGGAVVAYTTGQWYLLFASGLNVVNSVVSAYESNQQHDALLLDHGVEVLAWWETFVKALAMQVYESHTFIRSYLDQQAK